MAESARSIAIEPDFRWNYRESARLALWTSHMKPHRSRTQKSTQLQLKAEGFHILYHISTAEAMQLRGISQKL
jgi:hypothetical protein